MHPSFKSWQTACEMMQSETARLKSYFQWYPFSRLNDTSWNTLESEDFFRQYIEDGSFVLVENMRFVTRGYIQKQGASLRESYLVAPVTYLYLLAFGLEYESLYTEHREIGVCLYAGDLRQKQGHYRKSYRVFCDSVKHCAGRFTYCLKTDITNFFGSMNIDRLISEMQALSDDNFSASDALFIRALLLYCGNGGFPIIQNHPALSFLATKVYLSEIDVCLASKLSKMTSIKSFDLIRYVDDLYIFFDIENSADLVKTKYSLVNVYADLLRDFGMTLKQEKLLLMNADEVSSSTADISCVDFTGKNADEDLPVASDQLVKMFLDLARSMDSREYVQEDFTRAVSSNFTFENSTATPISIFRQCLYRHANIFKEEKVVDALRQTLNKGNVAFSFNTNEMVQCVLKTADEGLVKSLLNNLFQSERNETWCSLDCLTAITYLQHRGMAHGDLIALLNRKEPGLATFIATFCKKDFSQYKGLINEEMAIKLLKGDQPSKIQYMLYLFNKGSGNAFEQASYYRAFFDRVSSLIRSKVDGKKHKWLYKEKELKPIYANFPNSAVTIHQAEMLRQNNPLIHASSSLVEKSTYKEDLDKATSSLEALLNDKLRIVKIDSIK